MELTGLEIALGGAALAAIGGLIANWRGQSKAGCEACRTECKKQVQDHLDRISIEQSKLSDDVSEKIDILFRMVRALIIHSTIPREEQERLLNDRGRKKD